MKYMMMGRNYLNNYHRSMLVDSRYRDKHMLERQGADIEDKADSKEDNKYWDILAIKRVDIYVL